MLYSLKVIGAYAFIIAVAAFLATLDGEAILVTHFFSCLVFSSITLPAIKFIIKAVK